MDVFPSLYTLAFDLYKCVLKWHGLYSPDSSLMGVMLSDTQEGTKWMKALLWWQCWARPGTAAEEVHGLTAMRSPTELLKSWCCTDDAPNIQAKITVQVSLLPSLLMHRLTLQSVYGDCDSSLQLTKVLTPNISILASRQALATGIPGSWKVLLDFNCIRVLHVLGLKC